MYNTISITHNKCITHMHTNTYIHTCTYRNYAFIVRRFVFMETNEQSGSGITILLEWWQERGRGRR